MTNLLLVDRETHVYQGLLTELHNDPAIGAIHPCETAEDALESQLRGAYDALLINAATLPESEALRLTREVTRRHPAVQVLVFGLSTAKEAVLAFIEAGANAYVRGSQPIRAIGRSLRDMLRGEAKVCPDVAAALLGRIAHLAGYQPRRPVQAGAAADLSPRQRQVLELLRRGMSNAEIADELNIEVGTVKNHVHNLLAKLKVSNRQEAARLAAAETGWNRSISR